MAANANQDVKGNIMLLRRRRLKVTTEAFKLSKGRRTESYSVNITGHIGELMFYIVEGVSERPCVLYSWVGFVACFTEIVFRKQRAA